MRTPIKPAIGETRSDHGRTGNVKATRQDWVAAARAKLNTVAIDELKILHLAEDLSVSRSSFYWYFSDMAELLDEVVLAWHASTAAIVERTLRPADDITAACLGVFECWSDAQLYDPLLDFAVRDWGRRNDSVAAHVYEADVERLAALAAMFERYGFSEADGMVRARLLYHGQLGYYAAGTDEPTELRLMFLPHYLLALTGVEPSPSELELFADYFRAMQPVG